MFKNFKFLPFFSIDNSEIMETLETSLDKLIDNKIQDSSEFLKILSNYQFNPSEDYCFNQIILPKLQSLFDNDSLKRNHVYLALISTENYEILNRIVHNDLQRLKLNLNDPISMSNYCFYNRQHWFYEILKDYNNHKNDFKGNESIRNQFHLIKLIEMTNTLKYIDITEIYSIISSIETANLDKFWRIYTNQILRIVDIVEFYKIIDDTVDEYELFQYSSQHTFLSIISNYTNLNNQTWHDIILDKITEFQTRYGECTKQYTLFLSFIILSTIINLFIVKNKDLRAHQKGHINKLMDDLKNKLLSIKDKSLQIELLEDIFSLLFFRDTENFVCNDEKSVRIILYLLKNTIDEIVLKQSCNKTTHEYQRLIKLDLLIKDAFWRLDLITNVHNGDRLVNYMLSQSQSLIHLCLKRDDFNRAQQVIEIFSMNDSDIVKEINDIKKMENLRKTLINTDCKSIDNCLNTIELDDLFDFTITTITNRDVCSHIFGLLENKIDDSRQIFYNRISKLNNTIGDNFENLSIFLISPQFPLDSNLYQCKSEFYSNLAELYNQFLVVEEDDVTGVLNKSHPCHGIFFKINEQCNQYLKDFNQESMQYLTKVYNYLHAFSRVLYLEKDNSDLISRGFNVSYFELLKFNRSELVGRLLFERCLDPPELEKFLQKLNLDFMYHVIGNCFPTINLHVQDDVTIEELYHDNTLYTPSKYIVTYIEKRNWLLSFLLDQIYSIETGQLKDIGEKRLGVFFNYLNLPKIQKLKVIFDNNETTTALQNCISKFQTKLYFNEQIIKNELASISSANYTVDQTTDGFETGEEILEDSRITNWRALFEFLESIPERQLRTSSEFSKLRNNILINLIQDEFDNNFYQFVYLIPIRELRIDTILANFKRWPGSICCNVIKSELTQFDCIYDGKLEKLKRWLEKIKLGETLRLIFDLKSWYRSHDFCKTQQDKAMKAIILSKDIDSLLKFIELYKPPEEVLYNIELNYLTKMIESEVPLIKIKELLNHLPYEYAINLCKDLLKILHKLEYLQFITDYLINNETNNMSLKSIRISLEILRVFPEEEQQQLVCLINRPLSILEVLLMNAKLDKFAIVLQSLDLEKIDRSIITVNEIDNLLRYYAEKSLDFRVTTTLKRNKLIKENELKLLQSMDSISPIKTDRKQFQIPDSTPNKDDWIGNDEVLECMCCQQIRFSMFNRRHHCRRCGRVVCYNCSTKRMLVESYGDIPVRVCNDCYEQTDLTSRKIITQEFWLLNNDPEHDKIVREEFSYEHAPSVSLCLSILKYHSKNPESTKFLLEQCEFMLKLLHPSQESTQEIDYLLVIKMLRSLAIAAKVLSSDYSTISTADRLLSQAELLGLLADRGCLNLIPIISATTITTTTTALFIDASILRRLRDRLIQSEEWDLALEITTKAGLDSLCIFAAWGKSCLKAGCFNLAREKFQRCFTNALVTKTDITSSKSYELSSIHSNSSISSLSIPDNRQNKYPLLLQEIIKILETINEEYPENIIEDSKRIHPNPPVNILNRIKRLNDIAKGKYHLIENPTRSILDPIVYAECIFYLKNYGTHLNLLEFYIRHDEIAKALNYILDKLVPSDIFIEIYMKCLKYDIITDLQREMSLIDSSLEKWTEYLKQICRHLEQQKLFNSLYQLQLFMSDYIRAAMTCIRFYRNDAKTFLELQSNVGYLVKAEEHLKQILEQEDWVEVSSISRTSFDSTSTLGNYEAKILPISSMVMKLDQRDISKHIRTIKKQIEIVNFLANLENIGVKIVTILDDLVKSNDFKQENLPNLFGSNHEKLLLAVLAIICDAQIEKGFNKAKELIDEFKLRPIKVYCFASKQLAKEGNFTGITLLVNCIKSTNHNDSAIDDMLDEVLMLAISTLIKINITGTRVEDLIKLISDRAIKISAYIEAKQLKTAYFLAVKYKRTADVRRIQHEAELLNLPNIKTLCQRYLQNSTQTSPSKEAN